MNTPIPRSLVLAFFLLPMWNFTTSAEESSSTSAKRPKAESERSERAGRRPNVIVLFIDDLGYGDIGAFGCPDIPTPNIDSLAKGGVMCTNGYTTSPVCCPSRTSLITGRYSQRAGTFGLRNRGTAISKDHPTIAEIMKIAGYVTGMVGRWDLGAHNQGPLDRGFMEAAKRSVVNSSDPRRALPEGPTYIQEDGVYWTERQGDELAEFVRKHKEKPFFLYFAPLGIHSPVEEAPRKYMDRVPSTIKSEKRRYLAGSLIAVDDAIGKLLSELKAQGLEKDTLIVFTGDNGGLERDGARNAPYRGGKHTMWDGGVHEPFIVKWPGVLPAGQTYTGLISTLDIYPTAATVAGQKIPETCDGKDFLPYLRGELAGNVHDELYFYRKDGNAKYCAEAIRRNQWRIVRNMPDHPWQLYDIEADKGETTNLAGKVPEIVKDLNARYLRWQKTLPSPANTRPAGPGGRVPGGIGWATPENPGYKKE